MGVPDLDVAVPRLTELLSGKKPHPTVQVAAARALVELKATRSAPQMADAARRYGADLRQVVEPALAEWRYDQFTTDWEARLKAPETRHRDLILALECLAAIGKTSAAEPILEFVHAPLQRNDVRVAAARAAGSLRDSGLEGDARRLMASGSAPQLDRLCAVLLLARHAGTDAQSLLLTLAVDEEPAVAVVALTRLLEIDPHLVLPIAEKSMENADAKVRQRGADAYIQVPEPDRMLVLARLLDDPHPGVRRSVCSSLLELTGRAELDGPIRQAATRMLAGDRWRGQEQAALLLGALDHEPAAPRLQELLDSPRGEVEIAAAWALKELAIPETLPPLLKKTQERTAERTKPGPKAPALDEEVGHLFELFGKLKYAPAEPLLREHVPKRFELGYYSRSAAIWSLGHLHAGVPDDALAAQFIERAKDFGPPAELHKVQVMSLISVGRMKAVSQTEEMRKMSSPTISSNYDGEVQRWVLKQLTGEDLPELEPSIERLGGWFLEPLDP
ncbi:MAG: phycocyanin alpha phycocyanobilin lyase [Planctomycetia bacterium]|nr:phycocyanin alpha phycocyanobilin lyase [Planctomycetia bacterium]